MIKMAPTATKTEIILNNLIQESDIGKVLGYITKHISNDRYYLRSARLDDEIHINYHTDNGYDIEYKSEHPNNIKISCDVISSWPLENTYRVLEIYLGDPDMMEKINTFCNKKAW